MEKETAIFSKLHFTVPKLDPSEKNQEIIEKLQKEIEENKWFSPVRNDELSRNKTKAIVEKLSIQNDTTLLWFKTYIKNLYGTRSGTKQKAAEEIVGSLVELMQKENNAQKLIIITSICLTFAEIQPSLVVNYLKHFGNFIDKDYRKSIIMNSMKIFVKAYKPKCIKSSFAQILQKNTIFIIMEAESDLINVCFEFLAMLVEKCTHDYESFKKIFEVHEQALVKLIQKPENDESIIASYSRYILSMSLFIQYFNLKKLKLNKKPDEIIDDVFGYYMDLLQANYPVLNVMLIYSIGRLILMRHTLLLNENFIEYSNKFLNDGEISEKFIWLQNLQELLEKTPIEIDKKIISKQAIKVIDDSADHTLSIIAQTYSSSILRCYFSNSDYLRCQSANVFCLMIQHLVVVPEQFMRYLLCMCSDTSDNISYKSRKLLDNLGWKYSGYIKMYGFDGIKLSFELHQLLSNKKIVKGYKKIDTTFSAMNESVYSALKICENGQQCLISIILNQFKDGSRINHLIFLLYLADNLVYFSYQTTKEVLYVLKEIDNIVAYFGTDLLDSFEKVLFQSDSEIINNSAKEHESIDLVAMLPENCDELFSLMSRSHSLVLLLRIKHQLQYVYAINDCKIRHCTSQMAQKKIYKKFNMQFNPLDIIKVVENPHTPNNSVVDRQNLIKKYLEFKELMLKLDLFEDASDDETTNIQRLANERFNLEQISKFRKILENPRKRKRVSLASATEKTKRLKISDE